METTALLVDEANGDPLADLDGRPWIARILCDGSSLYDFVRARVRQIPGLSLHTIDEADGTPAHPDTLRPLMTCRTAAP